MNTFYPIKGFEENYAVNKLGQIKNIKRNTLINLSPDYRAGVLKVSLSLDGRTHSYNVHSLMFNHFWEGELPIPGRRYFIKHKDGDLQNCAIDNLFFTYKVKEAKPKPEKKKREIVKKINKIKVARTPKPIKLKKEDNVKAKRGFDKTYCGSGHYTKNDMLIYEVILSKGMGKRSKKLEAELYKITEGVWMKLTKNLYHTDFKYDMLNDALLHVYKKFGKFDEKKYDNAIAFYSEISKRALADSYNKNVFKTERYLLLGRNKFISLDSLYNR